VSSSISESDSASEFHPSGHGSIHDLGVSAGPASRPAGPCLDPRSGISSPECHRGRRATKPASFSRTRRARKHLLQFPDHVHGQTHRPPWYIRDAPRLANPPGGIGGETKPRSGSNLSMACMRPRCPPRSGPTRARPRPDTPWRYSRPGADCVQYVGAQRKSPARALWRTRLFSAVNSAVRRTLRRLGSQHVTSTRLRPSADNAISEDA